MFVDHDLGTAVKYLHEAVVRLTTLVQSLIFLLIVTNPLLEIVQNSVLSEICVIGTGSLDLLDVGLDDGVIIANRLHKEQLVSLLDHNPLI